MLNSSPEYAPLREECLMNNRTFLDTELLMTGFMRSYDDYRKANSLRCGASREHTLGLQELARWPEARAWLVERL